MIGWNLPKIARTACRLLLAAVLLLAGAATRAAEPAGVATVDTNRSRPISFGTDVVPILTKLGCNGGGCHGKATGQNGFRLSLFGFEPDVDYDALVTEGRRRRLSFATPDQSLLLLKGTARVPHGGGRRLDEGDADYRVLTEWIAQGARAPADSDPRLVRIEVSPTEQVLPVQSTLPLRVTAYFSDGTARDVTRQAVYQSNEPGIANVDDEGRVSTGPQRGLAAIMARFGEQLAVFQAAVPFANEPAARAAAERQLDDCERATEPSFVDRLMFRQWRRLGVVPSAPADDATFLRRASIDICGTLPTPADVAEYLADTRGDKRLRLINRLLERPEYASYFALKWSDILQNRGAGYSTSKQRAGTTLFSGWIRDSLAANKPYDRFVSEIITASGSQGENPPAVWFRTVRKSPEYVEVGSSRVDLQACKLEYSIVSPK